MYADATGDSARLAVCAAVTHCVLPLADNLPVAADLTVSNATVVHPFPQRRAEVCSGDVLAVRWVSATDRPDVLDNVVVTTRSPMRAVAIYTRATCDCVQARLLVNGLFSYDPDPNTPRVVRLTRIEDPADTNVAVLLLPAMLVAILFAQKFCCAPPATKAVPPAFVQRALPPPALVPTQTRNRDNDDDNHAASERDPLKS